jgi:nucleotide-binding universal stress UspA family protein
MVLFCVLSTEPEFFLDDAEGPSSGRAWNVTSDWKTQQRNAIDRFMANACQILVDRGFPREAVRVGIQERKVGIARDIIREAQNGYDAVVAGRQGMNPITRLVIGSIASKLVQSLTFVPFWLVGKAVPSNRMLVAVDASEGSMRAVEHIGRMLSGSNVELTLFRVIRSRKSEVAGQEDSKAKSDEESTLRRAFEKAFEILEKNGISHDQISTKILSGVATRSGCIIAQATNGGYGTIVLGRRGHTEVGEFSMGRVTNKVIQLAGKVAVWVVN